MTPVLVLVDLQEDFLATPGLEPHRDTIVAGAAPLLAAARLHGVDVVHIRTTVHRAPDDRMLHWKSTDRWLCVAETAGHAAPPALEPRAGETIVDKTGFGTNGDAALGRMLAESRHDLAIVAGVHAHACVRQAVLQYYDAGIPVWVARDAIGSHEPGHAAVTEAYLRRRAIRYVRNEDILALLSPARGGSESAAKTAPDMPEIGQAVQALRIPVTALEARLQALTATADLVERRADQLSELIVLEVGKPIRFARGEVARVAALLRAVARRAAGDPAEWREPEAVVRRRPLGIVGIISPWNNPLAIAAGQIAPALAYGNAVLWKPAPAGTRCADALYRLFIAAGVAERALILLAGGDEAGLALAAHPGVDALCFTGATASGRVVAALCAERNVPLQAELGGNNAAIVTRHTDVDRAARELAQAAFGCAGQRCTATRRVIVMADVYEPFVAQLTRSTALLGWGDPWGEAVQVGPLVSAHHAARVAACVDRAREAGFAVMQPHLAAGGAIPAGPRYYPPTLIKCDDPTAEIVQEETFGPVLVIQVARTFDEAMVLLNGVRQGLAAALYSDDPAHRQIFLDRAEAGILKLDQPTVEAGVDVPFGGWKASGRGAPQHGIANRDAFTRLQAVYGEDGGGG